MLPLGLAFLDLGDRLSLLSALLRKNMKALRSMGSHLFADWDWCSTKMREGGMLHIRCLGVGGANRHAAVKRSTGLSDAKLFKKADARLGSTGIGGGDDGSLLSSTITIPMVGKLPEASHCDASLRVSRH